MDPKTRASYARGTQWHTEKFDSYDLSPLIDRFLDLVKGKRILDLGCGIGRDVAVFRERGCRVTGIDASPELLAVAKLRMPDADLREMDFLHLDFPDAPFDGIWAAASLLHVPKAKLPTVLREVVRVLKPEGALFSSWKEGEGESMIPDYTGAQGRFFAFYTKVEISGIMEQAGLKVMEAECSGDAKYRKSGKFRVPTQQWIYLFAKK